MGGRGPFGQFVFVLLICSAAIAWIIRQILLGTINWRWSGVEWLLLGGATIVVFQLIPLPQPTLFNFSSSIRDLLPLWTNGGAGGVQLGEWSTLSLTPESTRGGLVIYLAYVILFVLLIQRLQTISDVGMLLRVLGFAAAFMAVVGLVQFFTGSTKFLGIFEHPSRSACEVVRGAFQNENHFAHFLSLGLGPLIWWAMFSREKVKSGSPVQLKNDPWQSFAFSTSISAARIPLLLMGMVFVALGGLLTFSRGGVLILAISFTACVTLLRWMRLIDRRMTGLLATVIAINLTAMLIFGYDALTLQIKTVFQSRSFNEVFAGRTGLWSAILEGISHFYVTGTGVGSHREVYPIFMEEQFDVEYTHGESGYLPLLLETGLGGLLLVLIGIAKTTAWMLRTLMSGHKVRQSATPERSQYVISCTCAIAPAIIASAVHSLADFVWYIPACMVMTIAQIACACRLYQLSRGTSEQKLEMTESLSRDGARYSALPRGFVVGMCGVLMVMAVSMTWNRLGPAMAALEWNAYLKNSIVSPHLPKLAASQENDRLANMERSLVAILKHSPDDARAHLRLASVYLKQFEIAQISSENSMDLTQIRDAALASAFPSKESQDAWLKVVLGDRRLLLDRAQYHSRQAVILSPVQGLAYIHLANLSFLASPRTDTKYAYIEQAARVRPYTGAVLFIRGKEAALAGDLAAAFAFWKKAFKQDHEIRQLIIETLADQIPANDFVTSFDPDTFSLGQLFDRYRDTNRVEEAKWIAPRYLAVLESTANAKPRSEAAYWWQQSQFVYTWLGDVHKALACQEKAVELSPLDFGYRQNLAQMMHRVGRDSEAISHYEWCLRRQPDRQDLRNELADAKMRILQNKTYQPIATKPEQARRF